MSLLPESIFCFCPKPVWQGSAASKSMGPMGQRHPGAEGKQVYVGNLSWDTEWQALKVGNAPSVAVMADIKHTDLFPKLS